MNFETLLHYQMLYDRTQTVPKCVDPPASVPTEGVVSRPVEESDVTAENRDGFDSRGSAAAGDRELTSAVQPSSEGEEEDTGLVLQEFKGTRTRTGSKLITCQIFHIAT